MAEVIRWIGISKRTLYRQKQVYGERGVGQLRRLKMLEEKNRKLKQLVSVASEACDQCDTDRERSDDVQATEDTLVCFPPELATCMIFGAEMANATGSRELRAAGAADPRRRVSSGRGSTGRVRPDIGHRGGRRGRRGALG